MILTWYYFSTENGGYPQLTTGELGGYCLRINSEMDQYHWYVPIHHLRIRQKLSQQGSKLLHVDSGAKIGRAHV